MNTAWTGSAAFEALIPGFFHFCQYLGAAGFPSDDLT
jgi:hypothetical protein